MIINTVHTYLFNYTDSLACNNALHLWPRGHQACTKILALLLRIHRLASANVTDTAVRSSSRLRLNIDPYHSDSLAGKQQVPQTLPDKPQDCIKTLILTIQVGCPEASVTTIAE